MIIVSQNKDFTVNFENIKFVGLDNKDSNKSIEALLNGDFSITLGKYKTKERAKEVLQEIANTYADLNQYIDNCHGRCVYKMPED